MTMNPEQPISQDLLDELSGLGVDHARRVGRRESWTISLPDIAFGEPAKASYSSEKWETVIGGDLTHWRTGATELFRKKIKTPDAPQKVPYPQNTPVGDLYQQIEPAEWYYNKKEYGLMVVAEDLSVAGLVAILQQREVYQMEIYGDRHGRVSNGMLNRVWCRFDDDVEAIRAKVLAEELGLPMSGDYELPKRGNVVLPDGEADRWYQGETPIASADQLYHQGYMNPVVAAKKQQARDRAEEIRERKKAERKAAEMEEMMKEWEAEEAARLANNPQPAADEPPRREFVGRGRRGRLDSRGAAFQTYSPGLVAEPEPTPDNLDDALKALQQKYGRS